MKIYHKFLLHQDKPLKPYVCILLGLVETLTYLVPLLLTVGVVYEHGFSLSVDEVANLQTLYKVVWIIFLIDVTLHISLEYRNAKKQYQRLAWILNGLLCLTLIPVISHRLEEEGAILQIWKFLHGEFYHLLLLSILSFLNLSNDLVRLLGRRTNPSLILAINSMTIILTGTNLLMLPRCTVNGTTRVGSLFTATSAVRVIDPVLIDVSTTFTTSGLVVIILLIQIGGLGVMTLTSLFAMFFMGNTSIYNQLVVCNMVSSNSLGSLPSTLLCTLGFTLVIERIGMVSIWFSIHGMLGVTLEGELSFAAFHAASAFCNAGFSTFSGSLGNPMAITNHNGLFISVSLLVTFGSISFPIPINFKDTTLYHLHRFWKSVRTRKLDRHKMQHLYNPDVKIVSVMTPLLLLIGTLAIAAFERNASFIDMPLVDKWTQAFFNVTCSRAAGFSNVDLVSSSVQTLLVYLFLIQVGGSSQSAAGGVKVNVFAVVVLNSVVILRDIERVEVFGRELFYDSVRRSNATVVISLEVSFIFIFILNILEPGISIMVLTFGCVSAPSTVGSSLSLTPHLCDASRSLVSLLMFIGRVGLIILTLGTAKQKKNTKHHYPSDNTIIN